MRLGEDELTALGAEGYLVRSAVVNGKNVTVIASYGAASGASSRPARTAPASRRAARRPGMD